MRFLVILLFGAAALGCGQKSDDPGKAGPKGSEPGGHAHGHGHGQNEHAGRESVAKLDLQTREGLRAKVATPLRFTVPDAKGQPLKAFDVRHDAKVHLIVVRAGLDTFAHLHPAVDAATGTLSAEYTFPSGGVYHLFADYQEPGQQPRTATARVEVAGDAPAAVELKPDVPGTVKGDGLTATVSVAGAKPTAEAVMRFELFDGDKPVSDLEPYMGATGHLVVISADAKRYVHAHPREKAGEKHVVSFGAAFPAAGIYKGWGQFKRGGQVRILPFVVRID